jgi:hypothetical protein
VKAAKPILASFFALLVLAGSSSFSIGIHLCGDDLKAISLLSKSEGCAHSAKVPPCHQASAGNCCSDELVVHEASQFKAEVTQLALADANFIVSFAPPVALLDVHPSPKVYSTLSFRSPPTAFPERNVLFRVFLI